MTTHYICNKASTRQCTGRKVCPYAFKHTHPLPKGATCVDAADKDFPARSVPVAERRRDARYDAWKRR